MINLDIAICTKHAAVQRDLSHLPHVIIVGGGFGGLEVARGLVDKNVRVTIIDRHDFHTFLPLLYQVATVMLEPAEVAYPIRTVFGKAHNVRFRHGQVRHVDHERHVVMLDDDAELAYGHLVIATGATEAFFGAPGASQHAISLYSLADMAPRLLTPFPQKAGAYALKELERMGVEVEFGRSVVAVEEHAIRFADGERWRVAAVIWAAGVTANGTLASDVQEKTGPGGGVRVSEFLQIADRTNAWAVGDSAAIPSGPTTFYPQLAPVAMQSGRHAAAQIVRQLEGKPALPFEFHNKGIMATIGRHAAVATLPKGSTVKGTLGWLAWLGLHLWYLVGFRKKLHVMINWTWRYFDWPSGPRLIVADAETAD